MILRLRSSRVERATHNRLVTGSNPVGAKFFKSAFRYTDFCQVRLNSANLPALAYHRCLFTAVIPAILNDERQQLWMQGSL